MRVAFCLFRYFPFSGLARDMLRIAECARGRGHDVTVFTSEWQGEPAGGFQTETVPASGLTNHGRTAAFHRSLKPRLDEGFDAVVGFNKIPDLDVYYAADACYAARARYNRHALYRMTPRCRTYRRLESAVFSRQSSTQILALSDNAISEFQEFYGTADARFTLLPPTLQDRYKYLAPEAESRARVRALIDIGEGDPMILMVGSGFRTKGVDRAVHAVAALAPGLRHNARLVIVGSGSPEPYISQARACGIDSQLSFLGGRDDVPELMAAADVLLHPAYNENTGAVLLEAMAVGLPVLTTDVCGYARYVARANAGLVLESPFNQSALDRALTNMLSMDTLAWRRNGPLYTDQPLFYSMPDRAVDAIERIASVPRRPAEEKSGVVYLSDKLALSDPRPTMDAIMSMSGEIFRQAPGRRTLRVAQDDSGYFLKTHSGVGWGEIFKNLLSLKRPVLGAQNEWHALHLLRRIGVKAPRPLGFGTRGYNPARRTSFVIMEEVRGSVSLEALYQLPGRDEDIPLKRDLIASLAGIARTLHLNGVNHRDFYLCHFLADESIAADVPGHARLPGEIFLIDLHRAQIRRRTPMRWIIKDLGGLYYSAMDIRLSRNDLFRFIRAYSGQPLRTALEAPVDWNAVRRRALALYRAGPAASS